MTRATKLGDGPKHLLRLAMKEAGEDGWAKVSAGVWPLVADLPDDLVEKRPSNDGGHIRLTSGGEAVVYYT